LIDNQVRFLTPPLCAHQLTFQTDILPARGPLSVH
jgi:hypothetical protein